MPRVPTHVFPRGHDPARVRMGILEMVRRRLVEEDWPDPQEMHEYQVMLVTEHDEHYGTSIAGHSDGKDEGHGELLDALYEEIKRVRRAGEEFLSGEDHSLVAAVYAWGAHSLSVDVQGGSSGDSIGRGCLVLVAWADMATTMFLIEQDGTVNFMGSSVPVAAAGEYAVIPAHTQVDGVEDPDDVKLHRIVVALTMEDLGLELLI